MYTVTCPGTSSRRSPAGRTQAGGPSRGWGMAIGPGAGRVWPGQAARN